MNEDAVIIEGPAGTEMQPMTVEDGSPYACFPQESAMHKVGMFALPCFIGLIYLAVVIFMIVMFYRLVRAVERVAGTTERIADKIEYCVPPKQDN